MVDISQINDANQLTIMRHRLQIVLQVLDAGGRIGYVQFTPPPEMQLAGPDSSSTGVTTESWEYPQQMIDAIRAYILQEIDEIDHKLVEMGITGVSPQPRKR